MPPAKSKLVTPQDAPTYPVWDTYVAEATANITPYVQPLPPPANVPEGYVPEYIEVPCPDGDQMDAVSAAQRAGDDNAAFVAIFGPDVAARLLTATQSLPFIVRARILGDVMRHYGLQAANTPT